MWASGRAHDCLYRLLPPDGQGEHAGSSDHNIVKQDSFCQDWEYCYLIFWVWKCASPSVT